VHGGHNCGLFLASAGAPAVFLIGRRFSDRARTGIFTDSNKPRYIRKPLNLFDDWCARGIRAADPVIKNDGF
jgi:hypothetical protein